LVSIMTNPFFETIFRLSNDTPTRTVNDYLNTVYHRTQLLADRQTNFVSGTIYVGLTSRVSPELNHRDDLGLILINDCDFDLSTLKCNAAEFPPETDLFTLFNQVVDLFGTASRVAESSAVLLDCLIHEKGLNQIIQIGAKLLGNPITLSDYTGKTLALSDLPEDNFPNWMELPEGYPKQEIYSVFRNKKYTKKVNESPVPVLVEFGDINLPRMIIGKIVIRNKIVGHLSILESKNHLTDDDIAVTKVLIDVVTAEVQKKDYYLLMAGIHHEYFILDLIQEKHDNPITMEDRVRSLQWDAYQDFYVVTIHIPQKNEVVFFVEYLRTRLTHIFPFSKSIYFDENVILVIYRDRDVREIIKKLEPILMENNLTAGISLKFTSIVDLKRHYEQAIQALSIGKLLKKEDYVFLYEALYLYDLLTILNRHSNLKNFCHPGVNKVLKYDEENGTDYYQTLYEYLMNRANMAQVAKKLNVHRNTLYHRINKISEIAELNLDDGDNDLKLMLSIKIMELYNISSDLVF